MPRQLSEDAVAHYHQRGYYCPLSVLSSAEVKHYRTRLEAHEAEHGPMAASPYRSKSYLAFQWVDELMRNETMLDAVEDLIGPDLLCWNTIFWIKEAHSPSYVGWHQDVQYWGLDTDQLVTAWVALSPATENSGCMSVLPGSHEQPPLPHNDLEHDDNLLTRGQEIAIDIGGRETATMALAPGEVSLHNVRLAHGSGPNESNDRRIGISFHYMPTATRQQLAEWDSAALVRGEDRYHHFEHTPRPSRDLDPDTLDYHARASGTLRDILYQGFESNRRTI